MTGLQLVIHQTAPLRADTAANRRDMQDRLDAARPGDLVVFPELSLTGYDIGARARDLALAPGDPPPLRVPAGVRVVLGFPERTDDGRIHNVAGLAESDRWLHRHGKVYLPTYGSFDEGRIFTASDRGPDAVELAPGWPGALLVCEDLWHPALAWLAALRGARVLVVLSAAPGRPVSTAPVASDRPVPRFGSTENWRTLARAIAFTHGVWVVLANRAGVEGGITFAGGSMVVAPDGSVAAEAGPDVETLSLELDAGAVGRARREWSHLRDDDPDLVRRELDRAGGAWPGAGGGPERSGAAGARRATPDPSRGMP